MSNAEAVTAGLAVNDALVTTFGSPAGFTGEMVMMAPPSLWQKRGLVYPVLNPTTRVKVTVTPTGKATLHDEEVKNPVASCEDTLKLQLDARVELLDLGGTLLGSGRLTLVDNKAPFTTSLVIDELGEACTLHQEPAGAFQLRCGSAPIEVFTTTQCLEPNAWGPLPVETRTQATLATLLEGLATLGLIEMSCLPGEDVADRAVTTVSVSLTPKLAEVTCSPLPIRAGMDIDWGNGLTYADASTEVTLVEAPCELAVADDGAVYATTESSTQCSLVTVYSQIPDVPGQFYVSIQVDDQGARIVTVSYWGPLYDAGTKTLSGPNGTCNNY